MSKASDLRKHTARAHSSAVEHLSTSAQVRDVPRSPDLRERVQVSPGDTTGRDGSGALWAHAGRTPEINPHAPSDRRRLFVRVRRWYVDGWLDSLDGQPVAYDVLVVGGPR